MAEIYWFGFSLLYFVCALDCFSIIKQKTSEFWSTLGSKIFNCEIVDQKYMIPCWWWRTGDLSATLAQSQKLLLIKFIARFIYWNLKLLALLIEDTWQMLMLILFWTMDTPHIFLTKCPAWNKKRVPLVFRPISYYSPLCS